MLRCIKCGQEYREEFNKNQCTHCTELPNVTNLYSTSIKNFDFKPSPLEKVNNVLYLKREDKNEISGTFKDRKSVYIFKNSLKLALASSGNQAISLAKYSLQKGEFFSNYIENTYIYVSPYIIGYKLEFLKNFYDEVTFTDRILSTQELTQGETDRWNISNGMDPIGASAYYSLAMELEPENFDYIFVPCGSGELYSALSCYFHLLRKKEKPYIIPVQSKLKETDAISTEFVAMQLFIDYFASDFGEEWGQHPYIIENKTETLKSLQNYSETYNCELSSAVVFEAYEKLGLKGKTCLVVTGGKK